MPPLSLGLGGDSQIDRPSLGHPLSSLLQHLQEGVAADAGSDPTHPLMSLFLRRCLGGGGGGGGGGVIRRRRKGGGKGRKMDE